MSARQMVDVHSERHHALQQQAFGIAPPVYAKPSSQPSARSWRLNDATIALLLVGTILALVFGVFG